MDKLSHAHMFACFHKHGVTIRAHNIPATRTGQGVAIHICIYEWDYMLTPKSLVTSSHIALHHTTVHK